MSMKNLHAIRTFVDLDMSFLSLVSGIQGAKSYYSSVSDEGLFDGLSYGWFYPSRLNSHPTLASLKDSDQKVVIYFHGGGFCLGSLKAYHPFLMELAVSTDLCVLAVDYRRAPEHPYPIPGQDCFRVYKKVLEYLPSSHVIIAGDSAGGALTIEVMTRARAEGVPMPLGGVLVSPWVDIRRPYIGTMATNGKFDILPNGVAPIFVAAYLRNMYNNHGGLDDSVKVSAIDQDLTGLPPLLIEVGDSEMFYDQILEFSQKASQKGVAVTTNVYEDMVHVFQVFFGTTGHPSVKASFRNISEFVQKLSITSAVLSSRTVFVNATGEVASDHMHTR